MRRLCFVLFLTTLTSIGSLGGDSSGTVGGTIVVVSGTAPSLRTVGYGAGMTFFVNCSSTQFERTADANGDFQVSFPTGKCRLVRVADAQHQDVDIEKTQTREFNVREDQHTRFDIMVRKSGD